MLDYMQTSSTKRIVIPGVIVIILLACLWFGYTESNLALSHGSAIFTPGKNGMNTLTIKSPFGYNVVRFSVIPSQSSLSTNVFSVGGKSAGSHGRVLFGDSIEYSNMYPSSGGVSKIPVETNVLISSELNYSAIAELPENTEIVEKCGTYVLLTKDPDMFEKINSVVESWTLENGPWKRDN